MKKLYYDKETGFVSGRYPHNYKKDEGVFIEVEDDVYEQTFSVSTGYIWKVENGAPVIVEDPDENSQKELKRMNLGNLLCDYEQYLADTDYIITKLNEAKLEDDAEFAALKAQYSEQLTKRKEVRSKINELQQEIALLK